MNSNHPKKRPVVHYHSGTMHILCGAAETDPALTDLRPAVTCPDCRHVLYAREEFGRTVDRLIPYPRC